MNSVKIHDVGMRDGLQMESLAVPIEKKIEWIDLLVKSGVDIIQLGSFVNPSKMPQMADTDSLFNHYSKVGNKPESTIFSGLVLNEKGLERGLECGVDMFNMGVSASETHSMKNTRMTVDEATGRVVNMAKDALSSGKKVQTCVQSAFGCGFEGEIPELKVYGIIEKFIDAGITTISLADTAGHANPAKVERMFSEIFNLTDGLELTAHFHNTYGLGIANCWVAMECGVTNFETAFGGLGGCPFTKLAAGNVCTEDFVHLLHRIGIRKDIELAPIIEVTKLASSFFSKELPGFVYKTGGLKY